MLVPEINMQVYHERRCRSLTFLSNHTGYLFHIHQSCTHHYIGDILQSLSSTGMHRVVLARSLELRMKIEEVRQNGKAMRNKETI